MLEFYHLLQELLHFLGFASEAELGDEVGVGGGGVFEVFLAGSPLEEMEG